MSASVFSLQRLYILSLHNTAQWQRGAHRISEAKTSALANFELHPCPLTVKQLCPVWQQDVTRPRCPEFLWLVRVFSGFALSVAHRKLFVLFKADSVALATHTGMAIFQLRRTCRSALGCCADHAPRLLVRLLLEAQLLARPRGSVNKIVWVWFQPITRFLASCPLVVLAEARVETVQATTSLAAILARFAATGCRIIDRN